MDTFETAVLKKYRRLSQLLILSALLNVSFISSSVYKYLKPIKSIDVKNSKTPLTEDAQTVLKSFLALNYADLVPKLSQKVLIEPGLYKRDLALALLHESYHVDLSRALNRSQLSFQSLGYTEGTKQKWLQIPRGLSDVEFDLIGQFLKQEAWPLTAKGLFLKLKFGLKEADLDQAFFRASEFAHLFDALHLNLTVLKQEQLKTILLKGDLADFELFVECVRQGGFSLQSFLTHYTRLGSQIAAYLLTSLPEFSIKSLSDKEALELFDLIKPYEELQKRVALELLSSFRCDRLKQEIKARGFESLEPSLKSLQSKQVEPKLVEFKPQAKLSKTYTVQEGDSLWKIARKFRVDVETLKSLNHLEGQYLKPGLVLTIP